MDTLVYCYKSGWINNWLGLLRAGIFTRPLTSPPLTSVTFPYERLGEVDLIYIALHGLPRRDLLWGDDSTPALDVHRVAAGPPLRPGCVVILEGCYGLKTPFPDAFMERGAAQVIASETETFDRKLGLGRAGIAGSAIVSALRRGKPGEVDKAALEGGFKVVSRAR